MGRLLTSTAVLAVALASCGCSDRVARLDRRDRTEALVLRAEARLKEGDVQGAVEAYEQALERTPSLARAHLDLAILLHDHDIDCLRALYHYDRYVKLRPDTGKKGMIEGRVRLARQAFVAQLTPHGRGMASAPTVEARESAVELLELREKNATLVKRIGDLEQELSQVRETARESSKAVLAQAQPDTYRVVKGDTLSAIAAKVYGDAGRWQGIAKANHELLRGSTRVIEGQKLTIP